ncbi:MAG: radical SAM protein [Planctomycetota bacterium]
MTCLDELQSPCRLCPRECGARRAEGELGRCGVGASPLVASFGAHLGEEPCLVGRGGSGTIFLGGCNLLCLFCQNADISHGRGGRPATVETLAGIMRHLEESGCENVNFVTPTHFAPPIAEGVRLAREGGLSVPVVWNCGGYEALEVLRGLEGSVEIYMPDAKTLSTDFARRAFAASDYPERMREALVEMQRQVGDLVIGRGRAVRGLLVRHLVMPGMLDDTKEVLDFLAREVSPNAFVNVMGQYRPCHRALEVPGLGRRPTREEITEAQGYARKLGLRLAR